MFIACFPRILQILLMEMKLIMNIDIVAIMIFIWLKLSVKFIMWTSISRIEHAALGTNYVCFTNDVVDNLFQQKPDRFIKDWPCLFSLFLCVYVLIGFVPVDPNIVHADS